MRSKKGKSFLDEKASLIEKCHRFALARDLSCGHNIYIYIYQIFFNFKNEENDDKQFRQDIKKR